MQGVNTRTIPKFKQYHIRAVRCKKHYQTEWHKAKGKGKGKGKGKVHPRTGHEVSEWE